MQNDNVKSGSYRKRYWLWGGVITVIFLTIMPFVTGYILSFQFLIHGDGFFNKTTSFENILIFAFLIPEWFVVGSVVGWLYGRIKNRRYLSSGR